MILFSIAHIPRIHQALYQLVLVGLLWASVLLLAWLKCITHNKGTITSKIKHAIKLKTSPARLA